MVIEKCENVMRYESRFPARDWRLGATKNDSLKIATLNQMNHVGINLRSSNPQ